ncbi:MAG: exodeoxyribonuclease III [Alphaproteobacteria bacterium]
MKIATWNVNSIKVRLEAVKAWLKQSAPDVLCLQEIKTTDDAFPALIFEELGYRAVTHGQKTYNGVAILSRLPLEDIRAGLPGNPDDMQARYLEAVVGGPHPVRVASIYLPNGNPPDTDKYPYKLAWMARLKRHARELLSFEEPLVLAGDYNVIPAPEDVYDPLAWAGDALFKQETRLAFQELMALGLTDAVRACTVAPKLYTFWDYQAGAWQKNNGLRIDHLLLSPQAADRLVTAGIDKAVRAWEQPSDHVPVWCELA